MLDQSTIKITSKATRMIDRTRINFTDSLSVPKIIGMGPMMTTPPPRTFPPLPLKPLRKSRTTATKAIARPTKTRVKPMLDRNWSLINVTLKETLQVDLNKVWQRIIVGA